MSNGEQQRTCEGPRYLDTLARSGLTTEVLLGGRHEEKLLRPPSPAPGDSREVSEGLLAHSVSLEVRSRDEHTGTTPPSPMRPPARGKDSRPSSVNASPRGTPPGMRSELVAGMQHTADDFRERSQYRHPYLLARLGQEPGNESWRLEFSQMGGCYDGNCCVINAPHIRYEMRVTNAGESLSGNAAARLWFSIE
eukprot:CAMPEP_0184376020 /NCGR_PEP_ID=MMETSP0007-20130409/1081_1 /TAXON_ID=97485 /ORGANISM="Prymnesium parvum, Strain Texoma1" /LENGTH=193 /DNA_ID=CAMNT_0026719405 /DNA_START=57 /DNA_END=639 /DNA_ORIENTATION=+